MHAGQMVCFFVPQRLAVLVAAIRAVRTSRPRTRRRLCAEAFGGRTNPLTGYVLSEKVPTNHVSLTLTASLGSALVMPTRGFVFRLQRHVDQTEIVESDSTVPQTQRLVKILFFNKPVNRNKPRAVIVLRTLTVWGCFAVVVTVNVEVYFPSKKAN